MEIKYVRRRPTTPFYRDATGTQPAMELLWGDRVEIQGTGATNGRVKVRARGRKNFGYVKASDLGDTPLLEFYFIDVGQGDGVLLCTPDRKHVLIDGGYKRSAQPSGRNAADFVDWKFYHDYGADQIVLDAMIASHNDADHYGGLWDLLNPGMKAELETSRPVKVKRFFTAGVSWLKTDAKARFLGQKVEQDGVSYLVDLIENRDTVLRWLQSGSNPRFQGEWGDFLRCLADAGCPVDRLSQRTQWLPGFKTAGAGKVRVRVLGPVETAVGPESRPGLVSLGNDSQNTNGNSVLLRVDYGRVRVLLTGDLNARSQAVLLRQFEGQRQELACDVAKACHHGSDDCSYEFLRALAPGATIISSGDANGHGHPRPGIVAASALTGHQRIERDEVITPLIYCTEIERSYRLGEPYEVVGPNALSLTRMDELTVKYAETEAGALNAKKGQHRMAGSRVVAGIVYGLVNVRTDGHTVLCATRNEAKSQWDTREFESRF